MNSDKLADTLDTKILDLNLKILSFCGAILLRPLALLTETIFRKNLGARYLTMTGVVLGLLIWTAVGVFNNLLADFSTRMAQETLSVLGLQKLRWWMSDHLNPKYTFEIVAGLSFWSAVGDLAASRKRQRDGQPWHSMSRGVSRFHIENLWVDIAISFVLSLLLLTISFPLGIVFGASRLAAIYLYEAQKASFWNHYMSLKDAEIQNEFLDSVAKNATTPPVYKGFLDPFSSKTKNNVKTGVARTLLSGITLPSNPAQNPQTWGCAMTDGQETTTAAIATSKSKNFKFLLTIAGLVLVIGLLAYFLRPQKTETSAAPQAVPTGSPRPQSVGPEPTKQKEEIPVLVEQKTHENDEARRQQEAARVVEVKRQQALEAEAKRLKQEEEAAAILEKQRRDALLKGVEMILAERNRNISNYNFACEAVLKTNELRMPRVTFLNKKAVRGFQERNREASRRVAEFVAREEQIMKEFKGLLTLPNTNTISELQAAQNTLIQRLNEHDTTERPTLSAMIKKLANDIDERFADKGAPLIGIGIR